MATKKVSTKVTLAVMAVFAMSMTLGGITPIKAKIYEAFPDIPTATMTYVSSVASLVSIPGSIITGIVAGKKLGMKPTILCLVILFVLSGCAPAVLPSFAALLITRGVFGFAMGGLSVIGNPLVTALYEVEQRPGILGISTFVSFGGNMILQYVASFFANINWKYAFLAHALAVIPLILVLLFLPETKEEAAASMKVEKKSGYTVPGKAWYIIIIFSLMGMLITPMLFVSSVYAQQISTNSVFAASVSVFYSIGFLVSGLIFGKWFKIFKQYSMSVGAVIGAAGMVLCATASNGPMLLLGMFIAGLGYSSMMPATMMVVGVVTPLESVAFATSMMMAVMNTASFLSSSWMGLIERITEDALRAPVFVGAAGFVICAVMMAIAKPIPKSVTGESQN